MNWTWKFISLHCGHCYTSGTCLSKYKVCIVILHVIFLCFFKRSFNAKQAFTVLMEQREYGIGDFICSVMHLTWVFGAKYKYKCGMIGILPPGNIGSQLFWEGLQHHYFFEAFEIILTMQQFGWRNQRHYQHPGPVRKQWAYLGDWLNSYKQFYIFLLVSIACMNTICFNMAFHVDRPYRKIRLLVLSPEFWFMR